MTKVTLNDLVNLENQTSAVNNINANNAVIETAFDNTLSRDGTSPNPMLATLDMNSNQIINLPSPATNYSPLRLIDFSDLSNISGAIAGTNISIAGPIISTIANPVFATSVTSPLLSTNFLNVNLNGVDSTGATTNSTLARLFQGQGANPVTTIYPTVGISRYEEINQDTQGGQNGALYVNAVGNNTSSGLIAQTCGITSKAYQLGSGDVVGMYSVATQSGINSHAAYGIFSLADAASSGSFAYGVNSIVVNSTLSNQPYQYQQTPKSASVFNQCLGVNNATAGCFNINNGVGYGKFDVGFANGSDSVLTSGFVDDSSSINVLQSSSPHTNGINLASATFSGNAFSSPGFSVNSIGNTSTGVLSVLPTTNLVAGGNSFTRINISSLNTFGIYAGTGAPTVIAAKGSLYLRNDGTGTTNRMYVNTDSGTTWTAVTTVA